MHFWNNLIRYKQNRKIGKLNKWADECIKFSIINYTCMCIWSNVQHVYRGLLFQWANTIKIQLSMYKGELIIISLKINLFSPWYSWKMAELALNTKIKSIFFYFSVSCRGELFVYFLCGIFAFVVLFCLFICLFAFFIFQLYYADQF
jgi:hypothetical protein